MRLPAVARSVATASLAISCLVALTPASAYASASKGPPKQGKHLKTGKQLKKAGKARKAMKAKRLKAGKRWRTTFAAKKGVCSYTLTSGWKKLYGAVAVVHRRPDDRSKHRDELYNIYDHVVGSCVGYGPGRRWKRVVGTGGGKVGYAHGKYLGKKRHVKL